MYVLTYITNTFPNSLPTPPKIVFRLDRTIITDLPDKRSVNTRCTVCTHSKLNEIHARLDAGESQQRVADAHGVKRSAIQRHLASGHGVSPEPAAALTARSRAISTAPGWSSPERIANLPVVAVSLSEADYQTEGKHRALTVAQVVAQVIELERQHHHFAAREVRKTRPDLWPNPDDH